MCRCRNCSQSSEIREPSVSRVNELNPVKSGHEEPIRVQQSWKLTVGERSENGAEIGKSFEEFNKFHRQPSAGYVLRSSGSATPTRHSRRELAAVTFAPSNPPNFRSKKVSPSISCSKDSGSGGQIFSPTAAAQLEKEINRAKKYDLGHNRDCDPGSSYAKVSQIFGHPHTSSSERCGAKNDSTKELEVCGAKEHEKELQKNDIKTGKILERFDARHSRCSANHPSSDNKGSSSQKTQCSIKHPCISGNAISINCIRTDGRRANDYSNTEVYSVRRCSGLPGSVPSCEHFGTREFGWRCSKCFIANTVPEIADCSSNISDLPFIECCPVKNEIETKRDSNPFIDLDKSSGESDPVDAKKVFDFKVVQSRNELSTFPDHSETTQKDSRHPKNGHSRHLWNEDVEADGLDEELDEGEVEVGAGHAEEVWIPSMLYEHCGFPKCLNFVSVFTKPFCHEHAINADQSEKARYTERDNACSKTYRDASTETDNEVHIESHRNILTRPEFSQINHSDTTTMRDHKVTESYKPSLLEELCVYPSCQNHASCYTKPVCYEHLTYISCHPLDTLTIAPSMSNPALDETAWDVAEDDSSPLIARGCADARVRNADEFVTMMQDVEKNCKPLPVKKCASEFCVNFANAKCKDHCNECYWKLHQ